MTSSARGDPNVSYQALDAAKITQTVAKLQRRIDERFPGSSLSRAGVELHHLATQAKDRLADLHRPYFLLRFLIAALVVLVLAGLAVSVYTLGTPDELTLVDFIQLLEAGINDVIFVGLGIFFLVSLERRLKRRKVLAAMHELRSLAHIVDMHQLTKDPTHRRLEIIDTPSSPARTMSVADLARYLDYCSELLSLTGKIAALYVQRFDDDVVLNAVNEIEGLTTGLAGKIWQKLVILESLSGDSTAVLRSP